MRAAGAADPAARCGATRVDGGGAPSSEKCTWVCSPRGEAFWRRVYFQDTNSRWYLFLKKRQNLTQRTQRRRGHGEERHEEHRPSEFSPTQPASLRRRALPLNDAPNDVLNFSIAATSRDSCGACGCRRVELRALCDKVPRTPPGPEGSNGTGNALGAADHPKFLSPPAGEMMGFRHSPLTMRRKRSMSFQPL